MAKIDRTERLSDSPGGDFAMNARTKGSAANDFKNESSGCH